MPAFTIVLSLLGAFAVMHTLGFTLDNLSLMALTRSPSASMVDDADVKLLENVFFAISRVALPPLQAAIGAVQPKSASTVLSISASVIAVFNPLVFSG